VSTPLFALALTVNWVLLAASVLAGLLWDRLGPGTTFYAGAAFSLAALLLLALRGRRAVAM